MSTYKVGILFNPNIASHFSGAAVEAQLTFKALEKHYEYCILTGNEPPIKPIRVNPWEQETVSGVDLVHCYQQSFNLPYLTGDLHSINIPIIHSPIIDSQTPPYLLRILKFPFASTLYNNSFVAHYRGNSTCDRVHARSSCEFDILSQGYRINPSKLHICKLGFELPSHDLIGLDPALSVDELPNNFILHISGFYRLNKNLPRLAKACGILGVPLVVGGFVPSSGQRDEIRERLSKLCNFIDLGILTEIQKAYLASRASCFALPSQYEGVGLAALEAASVGANICITERGGASDYFADYGHYVNPASVKSIARGIESAISTPKSDKLAKHVNTNYSLTAYAGRLIESYRDVIKRSDS